VADFLAAFKQIVTAGRGLDLIPRAETNDTLLALGLTRETCEAEIVGLSSVHYSSGPEADRDKSGTVWVFGKVIDGREVYIKLKIAQVGPERIAKCISFHFAEHPLRYPLHE